MGRAGEELAIVAVGSRVLIRDEDGQEHVLRIRGDAPESWSADSIIAAPALPAAEDGYSLPRNNFIEIGYLSVIGGTSSATNSTVNSNCSSDSGL